MLEEDRRNQVKQEALKWPLGDWIHGLPLYPSTDSLLSRAVEKKRIPADVKKWADGLANDVKDLTD